jgi:Zn-dependent peptidase ImmA (M78 family)
VQEDDKDAVQKLGFVPSSDYGRPMVPTYEVGYDLASRTRELLGIRPVEPIKSLKDLIETRLRVPVIQLEIHSDFAGATIATGARRGIAINLNGDNSNPLVRRMTMAHELGHLLWDPDQSLEKLCVDRYDDIGADNHVLNNVERRANAFAIEFLAPRDAIRNEFQSSGADAAGLERVIRKFGVGRTAITYHLANATHNAIDVSQVRLPFLSFQEWEAVESLAVPVFAPNDVPVSRRGRFAYYVYKAFIAGLISDDTAASLYGCNVTELNAALESTKNYVAPT